MEKPDRFWALKTHVEQARRKVKETEEETRIRSCKVKCLGSRVEEMWLTQRKK